MNKFTEEQQAAIDAPGKTIVSASAGSGKTTVMIEKIVRLIISGTDVKEILAVTFTKKAAAQMKEKLRRELVRAINDPSATAERRAALRKQLSEVPGADISTIHSFCSRLIRAHFFAAGVDGGFSVIAGDDAEGTELKSKALDEVFENAYEEGEERFTRLLSVYWRKKSDNRLRGVLSDLYEELRQRADYREFLKNSVPFTEEKFDRIAGELFALLKEKCAWYAALAESELKYFSSVGREKSERNAKEILSALAEIRASADYFSACALPCPAFGQKERKKKGDGEEMVFHIERLAAIRDKVRDIFSENAGVRTREEELAAYLSSGEIAECLAEYLLRFDDRFGELKRERALLDYNDLEHVALSLLTMPAVAEEVRKRYKYVFVDEYQDVNPVQEKILSAVGGENVFLVGDIKQSIYGFRGSKSVFFARKQQEYERAPNASSLYLTRNFRSSDAVLEAVNAQFVLAMKKDSAGIDYSSGSVMERGGRYAVNSGRVQIHFPEKEKSEKGGPRGVYSVEKNWLKQRNAASSYAACIRRIIERERNARYFDPDSGEFRRVEYSDIAVLSRKKGGRITEVISALTEEGIPVTAAAAVNICDYPEVKTLIDILDLIDNAQQDIPLCSALMSAMGGLTAEDLARIRIAYPEKNFFRDCCRAYSEEVQDGLAEKLRRFYEYLDNLRSLSAVEDAGELLVGILSETQMEARLLSRDNGEECLRRIHRFIAETVEPEPLSVHAFLDRLRALGNRIEYSENGGENSVRVLTMHASKGLEYPVVILDDLSAPFHGADRDEVLLDEEFGPAPKCYRPESMTVSSTLLRRLCEKRGQADEIRDELNLFYVALTRAKYGLHLIFTSRPPMSDVKYAKSFSEFVDFSVWEKYIAEEENDELPYQERQALVLSPDEKLSEEIVRAFTWKYAWPQTINLTVKSSATEMMEREDKRADECAPREYSREYYSVPVLFDEPEEDAEEAELPETPETPDADEKEKTEENAGERVGKRADAAAVGIAYHAFLEHFDFTKPEAGHVREAVDEELRRISEENLMSAEEIALLDPARLARILSAPVFSGFSDMRLYREQKFLVSLPAAEVWPGDYGGEEVLFQGAIDLLAISSSGDVRIVDYKYSGRDKAALREDYMPQLSLYKKAVSKILKVSTDRIRCSIINIRLGFELEM